MIREKPAELPIEQRARLELVINLKPAKTGMNLKPAKTGMEAVVGWR